MKIIILIAYLLIYITLVVICAAATFCFIEIIKDYMYAKKNHINYKEMYKKINEQRYAKKLK